MKKEDIVEMVYLAHGALTRKEAAQVVEQFFSLIKESLRSGEHVKLSGFGVFRLSRRKEKRGKHPKTGADVVISSRKTVTFAISSKGWNGENHGE